MTTLKPALLIAAMLLSGCATSHTRLDFYDQSTTTLLNYRQMAFVSADARRVDLYADLGLVSGFSCRRDSGDDWTEEGSETMKIVLDQLKLNAAVLGVTHVTTPDCVSSHKTDFANNCYSSMTCTSNALLTITPQD